MPQIISLEVLNNCVVNLRQQLASDKIHTGTGTFVSNGAKLFLLTADHVAKEMKEDCQLILRGDNDSPLTLRIQQICKLTLDNRIPWISHPTADVALLELVIEKDLLSSIFQNRFLSVDNIYREKVVVSRDLQLTMIGFPLGLGAVGHFSPFTFRTYVSSGLITLPRFDNKKQSDFFVLENPGMGGYSGGPIFDLSVYKHGAMTTTGSGTFLRGIMHGTISDQTGGKLSAVTPSYYIFDLLK